MQPLIANHQELWFLPLGGTGEIGMNLNLYGHAGKWLMVDCGNTFNVPLDAKCDDDLAATRKRVVIPDASFIIDHKEHLVGIVLTHAHEDHIGALINIWPQLQCPIYATAFTAEVIRRKFYREEIFYDLPIVIINSGDNLDLGPFNVKWLNITHSIAETQALLITTVLGAVFHTADWKIDPSPVLGARFRSAKFKKLAHENVLAMVCDSTNATRSGYSVSESECAEGLKTLIKEQKNRVVVTCFASNLARLISLVKIAQATNRYVALFGRSLENMLSIARQTNIWPDELDVVPARHIGYLPKNEVMVIATGSQGEKGAALHKLSDNNHRHCDLEPDDTVIFSSMVIPGNEKSIENLVSKFRTLGVSVHQSDSSMHCIHASGHPNERDLMDMYQWVKPFCAIPTHGEKMHMLRNAQLAKNVQIPNQLVGKNGDLFCIAPKYELRPDTVSTGRVAVEN